MGCNVHLTNYVHVQTGQCAVPLCGGFSTERKGNMCLVVAIVLHDAWTQCRLIVDRNDLGGSERILLSVVLPLVS
jgi:hypothetical protein